MIKLENFEVIGWEHAIRGMRNPMNSWDRGDSFECVCDTPIFAECEECVLRVGEEPHDICTRGDISHVIGPNDHELMMKLRNAGTDHRKFMRMITVYVDITAPLYWWKEFDTYKVGTVANSCSTMHKIAEKEFTLDDFSYERLAAVYDENGDETGLTIDVSPYKTGDILFSPIGLFGKTVELLNICRDKYNETKVKPMKDESKRKELLKLYFDQMIQLLPSSYNQKRTVMLNYEVLANIYRSRKNHKLDCWVEFCKWIEKLPYSEIITGREEIMTPNETRALMGEGETDDE